MTRPMQWTQAVALLAELAKEEDGYALKMGDHLNYIEKQWRGRSKMKLAAAEAGVTWSLARQRSWVARCIPPGHSLRSTHLSYSHFRAIANTDDPEKWGTLALAHNWSVAQLKEEIDKAGARIAVDEGQPCAHCEQPMTDEDLVISLRVGSEKATRYCGVGCAAALLNHLLEAERTGSPLSAADIDEAFSL